MLRVIVGFPERGAAGVGATNGCDRGSFRCRPVGETDGVAQRGGYDVEEEPLPVVLDGVDTSSSHLLSDVERQVYGRRILRLAGSRLPRGKAAVPVC